MARSKRQKKKTQKKVRSKGKFNIFVLWGSGTRQHIRRVSVKTYKGYVKVGKYGRYNLYSKRKKSISERLVEKTKTKITSLLHPIRSKREEKIARIKGIGRIIESEKDLERRLLVNPGRYKAVSRKFLSRQINPRGLVMTDGKVYKSFAELDRNKFGIYKKIILGNIKNEKLVKNIYANRRTILRDGMVIRLKMFGSVNNRVRGLKYLGTFEIVGMLLEEIKAIEGYVGGYAGYLQDLNTEMHHIIQSKGGKRVKLIDNNSVGTNVKVTSVQIEYDFA